MEQLWQIDPPFGDQWIADILTKESETLTKALQQTFSSQSSPEDVVNSLFVMPDLTSVTTPTISGGSENEYSPPKKRSTVVPPSGRVTKRKSRASKRATTTFITADASNFRQMVQQVTGPCFGDLSVVRPEPHRLQPVGFHLPTLDSSSTFYVDDPSGYLAPQAPSPAASFPDAVVGGVDFHSFRGYPTLESWKVSDYLD